MLITTTTAAKILDRSEATVRRLERLGVLPAKRTANGQRIFEQADVERVARERAAGRRAADPSEAA